jgi:hypothetical protein
MILNVSNVQPETFGHLSAAADGAVFGSRSS